MATRKTVNKQSKKVSADIEFNQPNKSTKRKLKKQAKKLTAGTIFVIIILLAVGAVGGFFGCKVLTKNDCFELIGNDEITKTLNEGYEDDGVKIIAFGKDDSSKVKITTNLKQKEDGKYYAETEGTYYITYTVDNLKYGTIFKIQKIRLITFVEPSEGMSSEGGSNE